jgi:hypothetical protein
VNVTLTSGQPLLVLVEPLVVPLGNGSFPPPPFEVVQWPIALQVMPVGHSLPDAVQSALHSPAAPQ